MANTLDFASPVPPVLDVRKVFRHALLVEGSLPLSRLERLSTLLTDTAGQVNASLQFGFDGGRRRIEGRVEAIVNVQCQRCLEPVSLTLSEPVNLALVADEAAAKELPAEYDPWVCGEEELVPADIIEEQLILGLPIVAVHQQCDPASVQQQTLDEISKAGQLEAAATQSENPFSVLAALKKNMEKH
tara:strand:- start:59268 stop:59828 length:561 start_codon:yes stop_codon:yes gene_type:complete